MPAFVEALDLPMCRGVLNSGHYEYSCGLRLTEASIEDITPTHWSVTLTATAILAAAHNLHHTGGGGSHNPTATVYFVSNNDDVLVSATCDCLFDPGE